ncbi:MAG: hypothetical protein RMK80_08615 [Pseudobdellovibrionaceae bacterium]|nr:hypothetical protein [Pseudobdellovibrionaceae bacterium]
MSKWSQLSHFSASLLSIKLSINRALLIKPTTIFTVMVTGLLLGQEIASANRAVHYSTIRLPSTTSNGDPKKETLDSNQKKPNSTNMEESARRSQNAQNNLALLGMVAGTLSAARAVQCAMSCPKGCCSQVPLWALGAGLSFQTSKNSAKAAAQSYQSALDVSNRFNLTDDKKNEEMGNDMKKTLRILSEGSTEIKRDLDKVCRQTKYCVDIEKNEMTAPNGKRADLNNLSPNDLAAMGLPATSMEHMGPLLEKTFNEAKEKLDKEGISKTSLGLDKEDGDSFLNSTAFSMPYTPLPGSTEDPSSSQQGQKVRGPAHSGRNPNKNLEGLSVKFNGEPIGVSEENIFTLINRRYELHAKNQSLILPVPKSALSLGE